MEKDYFKDRPYEYINNPDCIEIGMEVFICEKIMQDIATELSDLTKGVVVKKLTNHIHDRGVKCVIDTSPIDIGLDKNFEKNVFSGRQAIGRVTYIVKDGLILTSNGWKREEDVNK